MSDTDLPGANQHPSWTVAVAQWQAGFGAAPGTPAPPAAPPPAPVLTPPPAVLDPAYVEHEERIYALLEPYRDTTPPEDAELGISTTDLPPARAQLTRFLAWIGKLTGNLESLHTGRERYLEKQGLPAITRKQLDALVKADQTGIIDFLRRGGKGLVPLARQAEKEQLEAALAADDHAAQSAKAAIAEADEQIEVLERGIAILERRKHGFANAALIEAANGLGQDYVNAVARLEATLAPLLGLASIAGSTVTNEGDDSFFRFFGEPTLDVRLPNFGLSAVLDYCRETNWSQPGIYVDRNRVTKEARAWLAMRERLLDDPRADVVAPGGDA